MLVIPPRIQYSTYCSLVQQLEHQRYYYVTTIFVYYSILLLRISKDLTMITSIKPVLINTIYYDYNYSVD